METASVAWKQSVFESLYSQERPNSGSDSGYINVGWEKTEAEKVENEKIGI